jgi:type IX secretion system PorP/SprF family membrane protein
MSSPSFENIDRWLFEYFEGSLSPSQVEQLNQFIAQNPELEMELEAWKATKIVNDIPVYVAPAALQKTASYSTLVIASLAVAVILASGYFLTDFSSTPKYLAVDVDLMRLTYGEDDFSLNTNSSGNSFQQLDNQGITSYVDSRLIPLSNEGSDDVFVQNTVLTSPQDRQSNDEVTQVIAAKEESSSSSLFQTELLPQLAFGDMYAPEFPRVRQSLEEESLVDIAYNQVAGSSQKMTVSNSSNFSRKFKSTVRTIQRMMDQPIALHNSKDAHLLVPNLTGFQSNFGMVGTMIQNRFQATSRNQWVGRNGQQLMNTFSWDGYVPAVRGGLGVDLVYNDYQSGGLRTMQAGLTYSPKISVNKNVSVEPALRFKMGNMAIDQNSSIIGGAVEYQRGTIRQMFVGDNAPLGTNLWYRDIGAGLLVNTKWFYAGLNMDNLRRHYNNIYSSDLTQNYRESLHFSAIAGTEYKAISRDLNLSTYMFYQNFNELNELWLGANLRWKGVTAGGAISSNADVAGSLGLQFDKLAIHYNADWLTSSLMENRVISHQISVRALIKPMGQAMRILNL